MPLTVDEVLNAETDAATLAAVVNGGPTDPDVVSRLGRTIKPVAKVLAEMADLVPGATISVKKEGALVSGGISRLNFVGATVDVTAAGAEAMITITGGSSTIGLFTAAAAETIPAGVDVVYTSGYSGPNKGAAKYVYDAAIDAAYVAAHPRTSFRDTAGRGFKLSLDQEINIYMFGPADDGATPDGPVIQAAVDWSYANKNAVNTGYGVGAGPPVKIPFRANLYTAGATILISHTMRLWGESDGHATASGSLLSGNGAATTIEIAVTAPGTIIEGISFVGGFLITQVEGEYHAIRRKTVSTVRQCNMREYPGDAVNDDENFGGGQTNCSVIDTIFVENCRDSHAGFGSDANAGRNVSITSKGNRRSNINQGGFLGDHYYSCESNAAGRTLWNSGAAGHPAGYCHQAGHRYFAIIGQEAWCSANGPSGTTAHNQGWRYWQEGPSDTTGIPTWFAGMAVRACGAYLHTDLNNASLFSSCYAEDNNPSQFELKAVLVQPLMGTKIRVSAGICYGDADAWDGSKIQLRFNGSGDSVIRCAFGPTSAAAISGGSSAATCKPSLLVWNDNPAVTSFTFASQLFAQGYEANGLDPCRLALEFAWSSSSVVATNVGLWGIATRDSGGTLSEKMLLDGNNMAFAPWSSSLLKLGQAGQLWSQLFAATATINTSDERFKTEIKPIDDALLDAWGEVEWAQFKFTDAVKEKGDGARVHVGVVAQRVRDILIEHNLDGFAYGLLCYDKWEDVFRPKTVEQKTYERQVVPMLDAPHPETGKLPRRRTKMVQTGTEHVPVLDGDGNPVMELVRPGGDAFGVRYEEALAVEASYQRRRAVRADARLDALEARLLKLEA